MHDCDTIEYNLRNVSAVLRLICVDYVPNHVEVLSLCSVNLSELAELGLKVVMRSSQVPRRDLSTTSTKVTMNEWN
jgi:hypothetical protein